MKNVQENEQGERERPVGKSMSGASRRGQLQPIAGLALRRLHGAARTVPTGIQWLEVALVAALFAAIALPVALQAGLLGRTWHLPLGAVLPLSLRVLVAPALVEEILFRVLPNPHPVEDVPVPYSWKAGIVSLAAYVLAHSAVALLRPAVRAVFTDPAFLALTALLGALSLLLYRRTGSLWAPVALHWLAVTGWLGLGGMEVLASGLD